MKNVTLRLVFGFILSTMLGGLVFAQEIKSTGKRSDAAPKDVGQEILALQSSDAVQRLEAICSLREKKGAAADAVPHLVQLIGDDTPANVCGQHGEPMAPAFVAPGTSIGREAAKTLAAIGLPAVQAVINATGDTNWKVRNNAVWTLGEIRASYPKGQEPRTMALLPRLQDEHLEVRSAAAWALAEIKDTGSVQALVAALNDQDVGVRKNAAWALGEMKSGDAVQSLIARLQDEAWEVRKNSAWALGEIKNRSAIEPLTAALKDESRVVRETAQFALLEITSRKRN